MLDDDERRIAEVKEQQLKISQPNAAALAYDVNTKHDHDDDDKHHHDGGSTGDGDDGKKNGENDNNRRKDEYEDGNGALAGTHPNQVHDNGNIENSTKNVLTNNVNNNNNHTSTDESPLSSMKSQPIESQSPKSTHSSLSEARSIASNGSHHSLNGSSNGSTSAHSSRPPSRPISTGDPQFDINLTKTASEMRQLIAARKKKDAKKANLDLREKYDLIQQL